MRTGLCTDPRFREHAPDGPHPERPERLAAIEDALAASGLDRRCERVAARPATRAELERAHDPRYLDRLERRLTDEPPGWLDGDTYHSAGSWVAALLAAGAAVELALRVLDRGLDDGIAFVRPPGHHATADRAMGFCLLNNVAVAAAAARAQGARVAIVDWDVHHGNGTEAIFWDEPGVLYVSTHQSPLYPGTGPVDAIGGGRARGATLNVPLPSGSGDAAYLAAFREVVVPSLRAFRPDLVLVSAGYDAHRDDPLASMRLSDAAYAHLGRALLDAAGGRGVAALLEGGYDLGALGRSAVATVGALLGDAPPPLAEAPLRDVERAAVDAASRAHRSAA